MKCFSRLVPIGLLIVASLAILLGVELQDRDLSWMAKFLTQAGAPNETNLGKIRLLPVTLMLSGGEAFLLALVGITLGKRISSYVSSFQKELNGRQKLGLLLFLCYGIIAVLAVNFNAITLTRSLRAPYLSNKEIGTTFEPEGYLIFQALQKSTPDGASILIRTRRDIKYLLNYHLYPRRFYFYPDAEIKIPQIPERWMNKHQIQWTLVISDDNPLRFALLPCIRTKD
jgi:hypothetical protein